MNNLLPKDIISNEFWNENVVFRLMKPHKYCVNYLSTKEGLMIFWIMSEYQYGKEIWESSFIW